MSALHRKGCGRRDAQRAENVRIGEGTATVPTAQIYTLEEMLQQFVFIKDGSQVAPIKEPQTMLALRDFKNATAASKLRVENGDRTRLRPVTHSWIEHPKRMEADTVTFQAGGMRMTTAPNSGRAALNLWTPIERRPAPWDWQVRAQPFVEHILWLWGTDGDAFIDWLAHIEQQPGILPHYGWVHISREHGKGRNWISSVLTRVWSGYVAASLDLVSILDGGFNGRMSRKLLAIVDEINEGGSTSYRHAQTLRQLVTSEHREINPKYGRQHVEYNACRWLMFSNHTGAIPLGADDRRFWIVSHEGGVYPSEYYVYLYRQLRDPLFIASVAELLKLRDISAFRPGERPPMTQAKLDLIACSQTEDDVASREVVKRWPVDLITAAELTHILGNGGLARSPARHAIERAGIRRTSETKVRIYGHGPQRVYAVRNFEHWRKATPSEKAEEVRRATEAEKSIALEGGSDFV